MPIKTFMSYVCHPFLSLLCMSFLCMATVLMLDDRIIRCSLFLLMIQF